MQVLPQTPVAIPKPKNLNSWGEALKVGRAVTCIPKSSQTRSGRECTSGSAHSAAGLMIDRDLLSERGFKSAFIGIVNE